jgi:hypothetical protein
MTKLEKCLVELIGNAAVTSVIYFRNGIKAELPDGRVGEVAFQYWENLEAGSTAKVLLALPNAKNPVMLIPWPLAGTRILR